MVPAWGAGGGDLGNKPPNCCCIQYDVAVGHLRVSSGVVGAIVVVDEAVANDAVGEADENVQTEPHRKPRHGEWWPG